MNDTRTHWRKLILNSRQLRKIGGAGRPFTNKGVTITKWIWPNQH